MKTAYIALFAILSSLACLAQSPQATIDSLPATKAAFDTLDTRDKYTKIILFDDQTWAYFDIGHPKIDTASLYDDYWTNSELHAYNAYPASSIPEETCFWLILSITTIHPS